MSNDPQAKVRFAVNVVKTSEDNHSAAPSFCLLDPFEKGSGMGYQAEKFTAVPQPGGNVPTQPSPSLTHGSNNDLPSRTEECAKTGH